MNAGILLKRIEQVASEPSRLRCFGSAAGRRRRVRVGAIAIWISHGRSVPNNDRAASQDVPGADDLAAAVLYVRSLFTGRPA